MPTLFNQTWQDNNGDIVTAANLNSHAGEHSDSLFDVEEAGTVIGGVGRDQPINITGTGASVSKSGGEIVVNVSDTNTDTRVETQSAGTTEFTDTSIINFDTSSDISLTNNGSGKITVSASGGGGSSVNSIDPLSVSTAPDATGSNSVCIGPGGPTDNGNDEAVVIGPSSEIGGFFADSGVAIGNSATGGELAIAIGPTAEASNRNAVGIGTSTVADDTSSIAIGNSAGARAVSAVALGNQTKATAGNSVALGRGAESLSSDSISAGINTITNTSDVCRVGLSQFVQGAKPGGTIANADLNNQEMTMNANSAEDQMIIRYKTSGGTVKTGSVALT
jgi:hypothetical protein